MANVSGISYENRTFILKSFLYKGFTVKRIIDARIPITKRIKVEPDIHCYYAIFDNFEGTQQEILDTSCNTFTEIRKMIHSIRSDYRKYAK